MTVLLYIVCLKHDSELTGAQIMSTSAMPTNGNEHLDTISAREVKQLAATDPNLAAGVGDYDHHNFIGHDVDDDDGVAAAGAELDRRAG